MKKKAVITVRSNSSANKDDLIEVVTPCDFYITNKGFRAEYDETEISGMEGTRTTIIMREKSFDLIRKGSTETKMEFDYMKSCVALYKTPYGPMGINIDTQKLDINMTEKGGSINAIYMLTIEGQESLKTNLTINISTNE